MSKLPPDDILTSSGRYPDRAKHKDCTQEVKDNTQELADRVNGLLDELGWEGKRDITSGFRTRSSNNATKNAAKMSLHMRGMALDLLDDAQQTLAHAIMARPDLLRKYGLWLEHPDSTRGTRTNWAHLDMSPDRWDRPIRVFRP